MKTPRPHAISRENTSQQSMRLIRSTARANMIKAEAPPTQAEIMRLRTPTEELLLYFAALDIAITDVAAEFEEAGLYRHATKREINAVEQEVMLAYQALYKKLQQVEKPLTRQSYDYMMLQVSEAIDYNILLQPPKRAYNIAIALARIICKLNDSLGRFIVAEALPIRRVVKRLERIKAIPDHRIDFIVERTMKDLKKPQ